MKSLARVNLCASVDEPNLIGNVTPKERGIAREARSKSPIWNPSAWQVLLGLGLSPKPLHFIEARAVGGSAAFG